MMISYLRFMLLRVSYILWFSSLAIGAFVAYKLLYNVPTSPLSYLGSASCQSCHASERSGNAFDVWIRSKHALAYQSMSKELLKRSEIADTAECYRCHTTLGRPPVTITEQRVVAEGVGCERCHGPGSEYSNYTIMTNEALFLANGGVHGSLSDCGNCHTMPSQRPYCPSSTTITTNAKALWDQIRHHGSDTIQSAASTITNHN